MTSDVSDEYRVAPQLFDFLDEHLAVAELDAKVKIWTRNHLYHLKHELISIGSVGITTAIVSPS